MKISVIVPYKNAEPYLGRCLDSLTTQRGDFEFILVNDHSTDAGPLIAQAFAENDERFVLRDTKKTTTGVSAARNAGLDVATGDWVTFLDADDYMTAKAAAYFRESINTGADIIQFNHMRYYAAKDKLAMKYTNPAGEYSVPVLPLCWCMVWNKLFRRELLTENRIHFKGGYQYGEDELFMLDVLSYVKKIRHVQGATVVHCFENRESLTKIVTDKQLLKHAHGLEAFLKASDDVEMRRLVCQLISYHWGSDTYRDIIGGKN